MDHPFRRISMLVCNGPVPGEAVSAWILQYTVWSDRNQHLIRTYEDASKGIVWW